MSSSPLKPVVLIVMDGWGVASPNPGNAASLAKTPNFTSFLANFPNTQLGAAGEAVGLPSGEAGNSEVGHINLGAGRVVYQDLVRINTAIADGSFFTNQAFLAAADHVKKFNSSLHLLGLIGAAGVHSSIGHLFALLRFAKEQGLEKVFLHLFTDGRDSPPTSALLYFKQLEEEIKNLGVGEVATIGGRYYGMDRDHRWERTRKAYEAIVLGQGETANSVEEAVQNSYRERRTDEFILPTIILKDGKPVACASENDAAIFFNFRIDRPRQLTRSLVLQNLESKGGQVASSFDPYAEEYYQKSKIPTSDQRLSSFSRGELVKNLFFVTMTQYDNNLPVKVAFPPFKVENPLNQIISKKGLKQLHLAESEKERFVTYYFNGLHEDKSGGEDWVTIPSPEVATYDLQPEMSAFKITDFLLSKIAENKYDFILVNFANPDMVGHTGVLEAGIKACEVVDQCLGKIVAKILSQNGACIITADHGNVEEMVHLDTGEIGTEHSANPVPCVLVSNELRGTGSEIPPGMLADIAVTILGFFNIEKPKEMTGRNLIDRKEVV
ncbi:2,3-bisphosphoglycerate-independent phosphoglycerate mutase [Candidatus Microgenomates bacterium]|nr:2,3-bisphosphoglycerate-independent phosphoglycerate mutase [Candidatus Microgenomates bacterium]